MAVALVPMMLGIAQSVKKQVLDKPRQEIPLDLDTYTPADEPPPSKLEGTLISTSTAVGRTLRRYSLPRRAGAIANAAVRAVTP
ncbi:hypothetical protein MCUN1_003221 [Malassezia cuniculi]|uniref:Uncharacterized protein n=1 Tax=Malassezia cuniculi TaxID=948313 RepID=A0AAF0J783_9BASI|nr:hypothetical protein MCUN1_003221 [Malassezia cuniculi]